MFIATGWTIIRISEADLRLATPLEAVLLVATLYALVWWADHGRKTPAIAGAAVGLAGLLVLGRLFCPVNIFITGQVTDVVSGRSIPRAELTLTQPGSPPRTRTPNARASDDGRFTLYVGWYGEGRQILVTAPGYRELVTQLGHRPLGQRRLTRDLQLQPADH
jgi:hypothetical protein